MKEISSNNKDVSRFIKTVFQYNKINQKNNIINDYFIVERAHELSNLNVKKN